MLEFIASGNLPQGEFIVREMEIRLADGRMMTGTEFERASGRGAAKKWKVCVYVCARGWWW
jgi:hypothetical protein